MSLKLGHVWSAEGLDLQYSTYSSKIPALVMTIFPILVSWVSVLGVTLVFVHYVVLAGGVEDIGNMVAVDVDMFDCPLVRFIEALVGYCDVGVE